MTCLGVWVGGERKEVGEGRVWGGGEGREYFYFITTLMILYTPLVPSTEKFQQWISLWSGDGTWKTRNHTAAATNTYM